MAERVALSAPTFGGQNIGAPNLAPFPAPPPQPDTEISAPDSAAPELCEPTSEAANFGAPELPPPESDASKSSPAFADAPSFDALNNDAANSGAPSNMAWSIEAPPTGAPDPVATPFSARNIGAPDFDLQDFLIRRGGTKTYTVHPVSRIEDAFTSAERDLLRWLWEQGRILPLTDRLRLVTGPNGEGARRLATQAGLIYNTFKNLTRSLATKFALDIVKPEKNLPTIYVVYRDATILERQRQAGYAAAIRKNGGGRDLVDAQTHAAPKRRDLTVDELKQILGAL
jgi:hypothetical protein